LAWPRETLLTILCGRKETTKKVRRTDVLLL
jgi:hypothetical protein